MNIKQSWKYFIFFKILFIILYILYYLNLSLKFYFLNKIFNDG